MDISSYYQDYRAYYESAKLAESRGNIEGARKLYRQAALALCRMAELESGNTREQRIAHAAMVKAHAEQLAAPAPAGVPTTANDAPHTGEAAAPQAVNANTDSDNPWISEGIPDTCFDDVVGMEDVKKIIRTRVIDQIKYPDLFEQYGLKGGTGVMLFGLPGTGKTTIARAIAHEINAPLYTVKLSDVLSKWVGESEKKIRLLFDAARSTPTSLIFFDDFDALGQVRTDDGNHHNNVIVELINQIQGFHENTNTIVLLASTNAPWNIDSALMRRFEHHIYVPLANHDARVMLLKKTLEPTPFDSNVDMDYVSDLLKGYNGADIVAVVKQAKSEALQRAIEFAKQGGSKLSAVTLDDLVTAAKAHKSSVDPNDITKLRKYAADRGIKLPEEI